MVLELLFEYGEHESSSVAQILNVVHLRCGPGQPSSIHVHRTRIAIRVVPNIDPLTGIEARLGRIQLQTSRWRLW